MLLVPDHVVLRIDKSSVHFCTVQSFKVPELYRGNHELYNFSRKAGWTLQILELTLCYMEQPACDWSFDKHEDSFWRSIVWSPLETVETPKFPDPTLDLGKSLDVVDVDALVSLASSTQYWHASVRSHWWSQCVLMRRLWIPCSPLAA